MTTALHILLLLKTDPDIVIHFDFRSDGHARQV